MLANCATNTHRLGSAYALHLSYNNTYQITGMHYTPRNKGCLETRRFDALLRNNLYRFLQRCASSFNFFIRSFQISDAFYKSSFFLKYLLNPPVSVLPKRSNENLRCARWRLRISVFSCDSSVTSNRDI